MRKSSVHSRTHAAGGHNGWEGEGTFPKRGIGMHKANSVLMEVREDRNFKEHVMQENK